MKLRVSDRNGTGLFVDPDPSTIAYLTAPLWLFMARWMGPSRGVSVVEGALVFERDVDLYVHRSARTGPVLRWEKVLPLSGRPQHVPPAPMATLRIDAGRGDKLRPGDIVGALTGEAGLHKDAIGRIDVFATRSYVAIARNKASQVLERLRAGKIKGRRFRVAKV